MPNTELTNYENFNVEKIVFGNPHPIGSSGNIGINLSIENDEGDVTDLILNTPAHLLSFGVQEIRNRTDNKIVGFQLPICVWGRAKNISQEKTDFCDTLKRIADYCKQYLLTIKDTIGQENLKEEDLNRVNPLVYKYDNGKLVEDRGPIIYAKLIVNHRTDNIMSMFINEETNQEMDPLALLNKRCLITAALKIESIFIGNNITLHLKVYEVLVKLMQNRPKNFYQPKSILRPDIVIKAPVVTAPKKTKDEKEQPANRFLPLADEA